MAECVKCPSCGTNLAGMPSAGICPKCLLAAGLHSGANLDEIGATAAPTPRTKGGFEEPSVSELTGRLPHLEILQLLGKGGMGAVYKARQRQLDRLVAVKVLPHEVVDDSAFAERFMREARALARLNHPNIVGIYDFGRAGDLYYFVMEYVDGANLRETLRAGKLTSAEALAIVPQVCDALQYAHDEGIVHRDIKPENILLDRRGRVKIADFGLAKLLGHDVADVSLTGTHQVMGTLRYMAPEQMEGSHAVDHRADIYSLGVVFYELLTGEVPAGRFEPPSHRVRVDVRLDDVVLRTLERRPERRYQHASEVKSELTSISNLPAIPPTKPAPSSLPSGPPWAPPAHRPPIFTPWGVYVIATLNVFSSLLLMFFVAGDTKSYIPLSAGKLWWSLEQTSALLSYFLCATTVAASIGLFLWKPWARTLTIGACWASLLLWTIDVLYVARFYIPQIYAELVQDFLKDDSLRDTAEISAAVCMFVVVAGFVVMTLSWLVGQAIYLQRPIVVAALEGNSPISPQRRQLIDRLLWLPPVGLISIAVLLFALFATFGVRTDSGPSPPPVAEDAIERH